MTVYHKCKNPNCSTCNPEKTQENKKKQTEVARNLFDKPKDSIIAIAIGQDEEDSFKKTASVIIGGDLFELVSLLKYAMKKDSKLKALLTCAVLEEKDIDSIINKKMNEIIKTKENFTSTFNFNNTEYKA